MLWYGEKCAKDEKNKGGWDTADDMAVASNEQGSKRGNWRSALFEKGVADDSMKVIDRNDVDLWLVGSVRY